MATAKHAAGGWEPGAQSTDESQEDEKLTGQQESGAENNLTVVQRTRRRPRVISHTPSARSCENEAVILPKRTPLGGHISAKKLRAKVSGFKAQPFAHFAAIAPEQVGAPHQGYVAGYRQQFQRRSVTCKHRATYPTVIAPI
jgi:hypothetical protein